MAPHDDPKHLPDETAAKPAADVSRRDFLKTVGVAGAVTTVVGPDSSAQTQARPEALIRDCSHLAMH